ncbi:tetratricopeptide repeat protein [Fluviicola sp.]|uniref:tetratricopeptide repeat protein n=1 Tax=Fluviicola sp. TaxID=1917219 RepID=UPI0028287660|nr:tetratricopeptide repeat protein [Fluviicola sp.]MDR0802229.1 hypothetical protein [Fluviicola sp.]
MKLVTENFPLGSYFYFRVDSLYYLFQLLAYSPEQILVQRFWSSTNTPSMENLHLFDVRSTCSKLNETDNDLVLIGKEEISANQLKEIDQYLKIKIGKEARQTEFLQLKSDALQAFEKQQYEEAIRLFSLAAPYSKYDIELYEKRGLSYFKLKNYSNALADFEYYLIHKSDNAAIAELAKLAKDKMNMQLK